jgi:hypothetical protein
VWLTSPWPGWWRLVDPAGDGGAHLLVPVDELLAPTVLPLVAASEM